MQVVKNMSLGACQDAVRKLIIRNPGVGKKGVLMVGLTWGKISSYNDPR